jgi:lipopolysaccharide export system protein LptA
MSESEIASVQQTGHVGITQEPAPPRAGTGPQRQAGPIRAAADRADYDGQSQVLHLSGAPRIHDGGLDMTANQIDFSRASGDAFAHGDVKASWTGRDGTDASMPGSSLLGGASGSAGNGSAANGPIHAVAAEAELHQSTQEVIFHNAAQPGGAGQSVGNQPRIWEGANSISAPMITLNRQKQTLFAQSNRASNPVRTVLVSNPKPKNSDSRAKVTGLKTSTKAHADAPSVIRLASGDLHYSEAERVALLHGGTMGHVTAETTDAGGVATVVSQEAEVHLMPADSRNRTGTATVSPRPNASTGSPANTLSSSSVDRLIARDRVTITWPDRNGTGDKLVYLSEDGTFTLTGTAAVPPRITDQVRGTVTGSALIFHGGDDSVTVEGGGAKTVTETRSPK